jgi:hypothetical protein
MLQENSQFNLKCLSVELWRKKDINKNMEFSDWIDYSIIENIKGHYFFSTHTHTHTHIYIYIYIYIFKKFFLEG